MKTHRSYSDHEIAQYVLGLDMPGQAADIQARLAHDDAAAARALKWEAYLLSVVDALPPSPPPPDLVVRIRASLGMADPVSDDTLVLGDTRATRHADTQPRADGAPRRRKRRRLNRARLLLVIGAAVVVVGLAALVIWANLRPLQSSQVQQTLPIGAASTPSGDAGH